MRLLKTLFPTGRRSLLWGVHQILWHPITVYFAWCKLYGRPTWRETVCIVVHDWGYWFAPNMDGPEGERHPEMGARIAGWLFGPEYHDLVLYHSRHYVRTENERRKIEAEGWPFLGVQPSRLCWADKLSVLYDPQWWYLFRGRLSGEVREYRANAARVGTVPATATDAEWFRWLRDSLATLARTMDPASVEYMTGPTNT